MRKIPSFGERLFLSRMEMILNIMCSQEPERLYISVVTVVHTLV